MRQRPSLRTPHFAFAGDAAAFQQYTAYLLAASARHSVVIFGPTRREHDADVAAPGNGFAALRADATPQRERTTRTRPHKRDKQYMYCMGGGQRDAPTRLYPSAPMGADGARDHHQQQQQQQSECDAADDDWEVVKSQRASGAVERERATILSLTVREFVIRALTTPPTQCSDDITVLVSSNGRLYVAPVGAETARRVTVSVVLSPPPSTRGPYNTPQTSARCVGLCISKAHRGCHWCVFALPVWPGLTTAAAQTWATCMNFSGVDRRSPCGPVVCTS